MSGAIDHLLDTNVVIGLLTSHPLALALAEGAEQVTVIREKLGAMGYAI